MFEREMRRLGFTAVNLEELVDEFDFRSVDDLYVGIGCGDLPLGRIVNQLKLDEDQDIEAFTSLARPTPVSPAKDRDSVAVLGLKGIYSNFAKCCNPAPGDEIVGYVTRGRGATIHRLDCPNVLRIRDRERLVRVTWGEPKSTFPVPVRIKAYDRDGLMKDISTVIADEAINIGQVQVDVNKNMAVFNLILDVDDIAQLSRVLTRLESLPNVLEAHRIRPG